MCAIPPSYSTIAISPEKEFAALLVVKKVFPTDILVKKNVSEDGTFLISEMMKSNPTYRPTASNALLHSWTSGQESKPLPCLDSYERKTEQKHNDKSPVTNSTFQSQSSITVNSGKGFFGNEQSFLSINIPPPAKSRPLASQMIIAPGLDGQASDLYFSEAAEREILMLKDQKPTPDLSEEDLQSVCDLAFSCYTQGRY